MLARPEWIEPEKREPRYPPTKPDDRKLFLRCLVFGLVLWIGVILPTLNALQRYSVEYNMIRLGLELRQ